MTLKYILLADKNVCPLFHYCRTIYEMLMDTGFAHVQTHEYFTPRANTLQEFQPQFHAAQLQSIEEIQESKTKDSTLPDPMRLIKGEHIKLKPVLEAWPQILDKLNQALEWTLFWYGKQSDSVLANRADQCSPHIAHVFGPLVDQVRDKMNSDSKEHSQVELELKQQRNRDILVVFCREPRVTQKTLEMFHVYCSFYGITDGVLVSMYPGRGFIVKRAKAESTTYIRILSYAGKSGMFYNVIRTHCDIPLYRLLNPLELRVYESRYGSADKFPKINQSEPVCQYYGFTAGQTLLCIRTVKHQEKDQNGASVSVLDQIDKPESWIDHLDAVTVI